jgi:hypothetical protein
MTDKQQFEAFLRQWTAERIRRASPDLDPDERADLVHQRAGELVEAARVMGCVTFLHDTAISFGGVRDFVRHLLDAAEFRSDHASSKVLKGKVT